MNGTRLTGKTRGLRLFQLPLLHVDEPEAGEAVFLLAILPDLNLDDLLQSLLADGLEEDQERVSILSYERAAVSTLVGFDLKYDVGEQRLHRGTPYHTSSEMSSSDSAESSEALGLIFLEHDTSLIDGNMIRHHAERLPASCSVRVRSDTS